MCSPVRTFEGPCFGYSDRHRWCLHDSRTQEFLWDGERCCNEWWSCWKERGRHAGRGTPSRYWPQEPAPQRRALSGALYSNHLAILNQTANITYRPAQSKRTRILAFCASRLCCEGAIGRLSQLRRVLAFGSGFWFLVEHSWFPG